MKKHCRGTEPKEVLFLMNTVRITLEIIKVNNFAAWKNMSKICKNIYDYIR